MGNRRRIAVIGLRPTRAARIASFVALRAWRRRRLAQAYRAGPADGKPVVGLLLNPPRVDLPKADLLPASIRPAAERLRMEAEAVLAHRVDYLGSGPAELGPEIDWHSDFKSGYRWPIEPYRTLQVTRLDDRSDAKVPWELSRGHQLLTLARAARLWEDPRFADELECQLVSWLDANPVGWGINWVNAMEVALRSVNWLWAIGTLEEWRPVGDPLRKRLTTSLYWHGRHVEANLERVPYTRRNHYLADLLGLLVIGASLEGDSRARRWLSVARREFHRELGRQTYPDGVSIEGSLPYHGLCLEMFLVAREVCDKARVPLPQSYDQRLRRMLAVSEAVRHPDGRTPVFGDQDSGRALPAGFDRAPTQDPIIWLGYAILGGERAVEGDPHEEVAWTLGIPAWRSAACMPFRREAECVAYRQGGLYVLSGGGAHVVVRCGEPNGDEPGHAHDDLLSYELSFGSPLVVDSGTYAYTSDVDARNAFRRAPAHNVLVIDDEEVQPVPTDSVFALPRTAAVQVEAWEATADRALLVASHNGYRRLGRAVTVRRRIQLDRRAGIVTVEDEAVGDGKHKLASIMHLAVGAEVSRKGTSAEVARGSLRARVEVSGAGLLDVAEGWVSDRYGRRERAPVLVARASGRLPIRLRCRFIPEIEAAP